MKIYKIQDRKGWVAIPERIANYSFPLSFGTIQGATPFAFRAMAEKVIKKYNLAATAHIEECEVEE
jgi:hypothetical protein